MLTPKRPYVGVTGFTTPEQVYFAHDRVPSDSPRDLMIGVLASAKSLRGIPLSDRWAKQFPAPTDLPQLFWNDPETLQLVHYSGAETMLVDLLRLWEELEASFDGFQLNIAWPEPLKLETFHRHTESKSHIVLQLGLDAVRRENQSTDRVARRLWEYVGLVDAVLVDISGGEGRPMVIEWAQMYLRKFHEVGLPFSFGAAGGLGPQSLQPVKELLAEFPDLSWDAQGRLRNAQNELNLEAVGSYLDQSFDLVR